MSTTVYFIGQTAFRSMEYVEAFYSKGKESETAFEKLVKMPDSYTEVATLNTVTHPEAAWVATQHFEDAWNKADGVTMAPGVNPDEVRSTMVGDVFVIDGEAYAIMMMGTRKLPQRLADMLIKVYA